MLVLSLKISNMFLIFLESIIPSLKNCCFKVLILRKILGIVESVEATVQELFLQLLTAHALVVHLYKFVKVHGTFIGGEVFQLHNLDELVFITQKGVVV